MTARPGIYLNLSYNEYFVCTFEFHTLLDLFLFVSPSALELKRFGIHRRLNPQRAVLNEIEIVFVCLVAELTHDAYRNMRWLAESSWSV